MAHPRLRGEHLAKAKQNAAVHGSSPLTRGAHVVSVRELNTVGLIPAYAGSTDGAPMKLGTGEAHPRLRGEHGWFSYEALFPPGSSPLTRGALSALSAD